MMQDFLNEKDKNSENGTKQDSIPWYIAGLAFECQECGRCCAGPEEGYVWATEDEMNTIADHLEMDRKEFWDKYVRKIGNRYSLVENKENNDCIFLKDGGCTIYSVRPTQCGTWPFWHSNIETPDDWAWAGKRCDGINRGELHNARDIEKKANATRE